MGTELTEDVIDINACNDHVTSASDIVLDILACAGCPYDEGEEHSRGGNQEKRPPADLVDEEALPNGHDDVEDLDRSVDNQLDSWVGDSNIRKDDVEIVGGETITRPPKARGYNPSADVSLHRKATA